MRASSVGLRGLHGRVRGTARSAGEIVAVEDAVIEGSQLRFVLHVTRPLRLQLRFDVTVEGEGMTGTAKAGILPMAKLSGVRQPRGS